MQAAESARAEAVFHKLSHDLRNTVGAILGWVTVMKRAPGASPLMVQGIEAIERNVQLQYTALEDLLDSARLSAGELQLNLADLQPASVARAALEDVRLHAFRCGVILQPARLEEGAKVQGDEARLRRVMTRVLRVMIDAVPRGCSVRMVGSMTDGCYEIEIAEAGAPAVRGVDVAATVPLPPELAVAAQLVAHHRGRLIAVGGEGGPATFTLRLPVVATA